MDFFDNELNFKIICIFYFYIISASAICYMLQVGFTLASKLRPQKDAKCALSFVRYTTNAVLKYVELDRQQRMFLFLYIFTFICIYKEKELIRKKFTLSAFYEFMLF